jgi:hypothetical protein
VPELDELIVGELDVATFAVRGSYFFINDAGRIERFGVLGWHLQWSLLSRGERRRM